MLQPPKQSVLSGSSSSSSSSSRSSSSSSPDSLGAITPNPCLLAALQYAPASAGQEAPCSVQVNPLQLLPATAGAHHQGYVHYRGSLTTPPCSEGVDWLVWQQPAPVTDQQVSGTKKKTLEQQNTLVRSRVTVYACTDC
jgi:carbonic anhydrase